ncbi:hypothetical protein D9599_25815 [Roseomonas sp. KE2513]|uniref:hypothetical protein n=1 Tax=Roseomonas sp. KE2513 TaxID=2479202 RepID=UPI0018DFA7BB|nr:hypothetical protein [Roseomonas sp. KE2513]MBI0538975.1 hypothetical protein [Roseomonas sp. KE2513]
MGRYWQFLVDLGRYFWALRYLWTTLLVLGVTLWVILWSQDETTIRRCGAALQLLGVATVAVGIRNTRRDFGQPGFLGSAWQNLMAFPRPPSQDVSVTIEGQQLGTTTDFIGGEATGTLTSSVQEQIDALRRELSALQTAFTKGQKAIDRRLVEVSRKLVDEEATRERGEQVVRLLITKAQTGGLNLSVLGTVCILLGTIMGGLTQEVATIGRFAAAWAWDLVNDLVRLNAIYWRQG